MEIDPGDHVVISSGHGLHVAGAVGPSPWGLVEVDEARHVVDAVAVRLRERGVSVTTFHDNTSTNQNANLNTIVAYHNKHSRELDVSVHFNAFGVTSAPRGTECLYLSQDVLAGRVSHAIADCGFINRGPKERTDLFFLNATDEPSILIEVCFVDSQADAELYKRAFVQVCDAIASAIMNLDAITSPPPEVTTPKPIVKVAVDVPDGVDLEITVNGVGVLLGTD